MSQLKVANFSVDNMEDLAAARDIMGPHFGLMGNVAPVDVMLNGSIDDVIETCKQCIIKGSEAENGYALGRVADAYWSAYYVFGPIFAYLKKHPLGYYFK